MINCVGALAAARDHTLIAVHCQTTSSEFFSSAAICIGDQPTSASPDFGGSDVLGELYQRLPHRKAVSLCDVAAAFVKSVFVLSMLSKEFIILGSF
jgi:hypothetical protein